MAEPEPLQQIMTRMGQDVERLSFRASRGQVSLEAWYEQMRQLIEQYSAEAYTEGSLETEITPEGQAMVNRSARVQIAFLENFKNDIEANGWQPAYAARAQMYASAIRQNYWHGDIVGQVGRVLPLPAYPAEGTQCLSNCKCSWEIETVNAEAGDYDGYWRRGSDDSCQTCVEREAQWSPVKIRGGMLL